MAGERDFWLACGHHLLDRDDGRLVVTDEFLKAYLARPELALPADACAAERDLHRALLVDPRRAISTAQLSSIVDVDARENWSLMIRWRDHLLRHGTLEAAYLDIVQRGGRQFPPLFINQLVQVILRNVLDGCRDAFVLRAAELFFRPQKLTLESGSLVCADEETISGLGIQPVSPLISLLGLPSGAQITVLSDTNAASYWERSDAFDLALDVTGGRRGLAALGEVMMRLVSHLLGVEVEIIPMTALRDVTLTWYLGLDADATRMGNALWAGEELDEAVRARVVGLYQLNFIDSADMNGSVSGAPTYIMMAMTSDKSLRLKPQNLLNGLPLRERGGVE